MILALTLAFITALAADLITTRMAQLRGLEEENWYLRSNPILMMIVLSLAVVIPAEVGRYQGHTEWTTSFYLMGAIVHFLAAAWNIYQLRK